MSNQPPIDIPEIIQALTSLIEAFERQGIAYYIGGSVASSIHGKRRYTQDVDIVADVQLKHVLLLVSLLEHDYYIDAQRLVTKLKTFKMVSANIVRCFGE